MGKHMKSESSSPRHGYNHKPGWLAGMLHVFDFHRWRTKNRPICKSTHLVLLFISTEKKYVE